MLLKLQQQKSILEERGYNVAYICVYGSQNYEMHTAISDIDMKAVIIPSLDDLIRETKPLSTTIDTEWGLCDLKDIRQYTQTLCKANPVYIETLYTKHYLLGVPDFQQIRDLRKELVFGLSHLFVRGALGQIMMKREALCHPYPSIAEKVALHGYDPKQLHHIARLSELIRSFGPKLGLDPKFIPDPEIRKYLMSLKIEVMPVDKAVELADYLVGHTKFFVDHWDSNEDYSTKDTIRDISQLIIKKHIVC